MIFAVDAGDKVSSFVFFHPTAQAIADKGLDVPNDELLKLIARYDYTIFAFEQIASMGFPVGKEVLDTAEWNGRFRHAAEIRKGVTVVPITRKRCVVHHTGNAKGGDSAIRTAMLARFGKDKTAGVTYDLWSALALSAFAADHMNLGGGVESRHAQSSGGRNSKRGVASDGKILSASCCSDKAGDYSLTESSPDDVAGSDSSRTSRSGSSAPPTQSFSTEVSAT